MRATLSLCLVPPKMVARKSLVPQTIALGILAPQEFRALGPDQREVERTTQALLRRYGIALVQRETARFRAEMALAYGTS